MKIKLELTVLFAIALLAFLSCSRGDRSAGVLARNYCGSCHMYPEPALLDKDTWQKSVLPAMGRLSGVSGLKAHPFEETDRIMVPETALISNGDWKKIVDFYVMNAPGILPKQSRNPVAEMTTRFEVQKTVLNRIPSITYVGINPTGNRLYVASTDSVLSIFDQQLNELTATSTGGITVDCDFTRFTNVI